jgi:dTDP-3-amino-3,4,6-trideoxy-alpha-D-glucose transaminase
LLLGTETSAFEREFAGWTGAAHACTVSAGAAAIQLALAAVGVGPGDEVILPSFTAVPTASAVYAIGAVPVLADVDAATACLTSESVEAVRTSRSRAVLLVHLYGYPAALPLTDLPVVEDAAQAHGALHDPSRSAATAYSFYPTKVLGGIGDGGAVVTDDAGVDAQVRKMRVHGMTGQPYVHDVVSQNFRMSELEAAWLRLGLAELDADVARRRTIAAHLHAAAPTLRWQAQHPDHAYHLCVLRSSDREGVRTRLAGSGVGTSVHYPLAVHQQPAYRQLDHGGLLTSADWAAECVSVPCFPEMTDDEVDLVGTALGTCG